MESEGYTVREDEFQHALTPSYFSPIHLFIISSLPSLLVSLPPSDRCTLPFVC